MAQLETAGYRRYWPMIEFLGREKLADGTRVQHGNEVYRDMTTGEVHRPESRDGEEALGWNGSPPDGHTGSKEKEGTERFDRDAYRRNYSLISWK